MAKFILLFVIMSSLSAFANDKIAYVLNELDTKGSYYLCAAESDENTAYTNLLNELYMVVDRANDNDMDLSVENIMVDSDEDLMKAYNTSEALFCITINNNEKL